MFDREKFNEIYKYEEVPMGYYTTWKPYRLGVDTVWPVHLQPKVETMNKKLIINVAPVGATISRDQNPYQPYTPREIADDVIGAYKAGASMFHIHCRRDGVHAVDPEIYKETLDLVFEECPDIITNLCMITAPNIEGSERRDMPVFEPLLAFGKKYARIGVVNPGSFTMGQTPPYIQTPAGIMDESAYMESRGVKPFYGCYSPEQIDTVKELVLDSGIVKKPVYYGLATGIHNTAPTTPDPEGYYNLLQNYKRLPKDEGIVWEVATGGHNWLPMAVFSIMLGCDIIRVGKEDTCHKYPHRDDYIKTCAEVTELIATIAKCLGREIATPAEAKQILGLDD